MMATILQINFVTSNVEGDERVKANCTVPRKTQRLTAISSFQYVTCKNYARRKKCECVENIKKSLDCYFTEKKVQTVVC